MKLGSPSINYCRKAVALGDKVKLLTVFKTAQTQATHLLSKWLHIHRTGLCLYSTCLGPPPYIPKTMLFYSQDHAILFSVDNHSLVVPLNTYLLGGLFLQLFGFCFKYRLNGESYRVSLCASVLNMKSFRAFLKVVHHTIFRFPTFLKKSHIHQTRF